MTTYERYLKLMNLNKIRPLPEKTLKDMWDNWHCETQAEKKAFYQYGLNKHWRERQIEVMSQLGIDENIKFHRGGDSRIKFIKFTDKTKALFAVEQFEIMRKVHFTDSVRSHLV